MKTAMQELEIALKDLKAVYVGNDWMREVIGIEQALNLIEYIYLEKEKEQILDSHIEGQRVFDEYPHTQWTNDQAEIYYNKTFNEK